MRHKAAVLPGAALLLSLGCAQFPQQDESILLEDNLISTATMLYAREGNCVHSHREGAELGKLKCSRGGRTLCGNKTLYDATGNLIITEDTQNRFRTEWLKLADDLPECRTTSTAAFALQGFRVTTLEHNQDVPANNDLRLIDDCAVLGNAGADKLASADQYKYLLSARGVLAWEARLLGEDQCAAVIVRSPEEFSAARDFAAGDLLLETTCFYGSNALFNKCTDLEKARAAAFDFANPL